jgi:hypothetical protein
MDIALAHTGAVPFLIAGGPLLLISAGHAPRQPTAGPFAALGAVAIGWLAVFALAVSGRGVTNDYRHLGLANAAAARSDDRVALYSSFTQSIGFYSRRRC